MHYYKRNLGDYAKKCGRLSMLEHGSYTLLMDACYDREQFPTLEQAIDWCWARSEAEIEAVKFVLSKFFVLEDGIYVQTRIQEELNEYRSKAIKNKEIATEREAKRKTKARTVNEPCDFTNEAPPNHKPLTKNQEPLTINHKPPNKDLGLSTTASVVTTAGGVCKKIKELGIANPNPHDQTLADLLTAGHTLEDFVSAAMVTLDAKPTNPWKYLLKVVEGAKKAKPPSAHNGLDRKDYGTGVQKL
jgi:uncharacterized protein YdaU (DUF1376 family)